MPITWYFVFLRLLSLILYGNEILDPLWGILEFITGVVLILAFVMVVEIKFPRVASISVALPITRTICNMYRKCAVGGFPLIAAIASN